MSNGAGTSHGSGRRVDPIRMWAGGLATALVAAGVAVVGTLVIHALGRVSALQGMGADDAVGNQVTLAILAGVAALLATGLLHLLVISTPRAHKFFGWIIGLVVVAVIVTRLLAGGDWLPKLLACALYLVIGIAIGSLLEGVGRTAVRRNQQSRDDRGSDERTQRY